MIIIEVVYGEIWWLIDSVVVILHMTVSLSGKLASASLKGWYIY